MSPTERNDRIGRNGRSVALAALLDMKNNDGYSNLILDKHLRAVHLDSREAALASVLFYGVLEKQLTLDHFLGLYLKSPQKKLDDTVRMSLRCGAYQILFLDRVPDSAAVNETVKILKQFGKRPFAGFVNGVLRNLAREKYSLLLPQGDTVEAWSLRYSVPEPLISLWIDAYGRDLTHRLLESFQDLPETFVRMNTLRTDADRLQNELTPYDASLLPLDFPPGAARLEYRGSPAILPAFETGLFHVEDLSAQLVCAIVAPQRGQRLLDCCAAPGGKTFTLAQMMEDQGEIEAMDLNLGRVRLIESGAQRLQLSCILARQGDATQSLFEAQSFDRVLCDVPCSGFGVIRRKPEIRYRPISQAQELPVLQYAILTNAAEALKPGGILVYSTCTLNPAENGQVADRFLSENRSFAPYPIVLPGIQRVLPEPEHQLTLFPFSGGSDGFFAAVFIRK